MGEQWLPLAGYGDNYEVSSLGRVKSIDRVVTDKNGRPMRYAGKILRTQRTGPLGYHSLALHLNGVQKTKRVHVLVLEAFSGARPSGAVACHNNGDTNDNRADNLRWDTSAQNALDVIRHGNHKGASKTHCKRGHDLSDAYIKGGARRWRQCRVCVNDAARARYAEKRAS